MGDDILDGLVYGMKVIVDHNMPSDSAALINGGEAVITPEMYAKIMLHVQTEAERTILRGFETRADVLPPNRYLEDAIF